MDEGLSTTSPAAIFEATSSGSIVILRFKSITSLSRVTDYVPRMTRKKIFPRPNPETLYPVPCFHRWMWLWPVR